MSRPKVYNIALIPGDGIGEEVVAAAVEVLEAAATRDKNFSLRFEQFPWSTKYWKHNGSWLPPNYKEVLKPFDAVLFGSVGMPDVPDHESLWGLLLEMRFGMQLFANVRPTRCLTAPRLAGTAPADIDWLFVRENSEGEYAGHGGRSHTRRAWAVATETSVYTCHGITRIMRFAFQKAQERPKKHLTVVSKSNALRYGHVLWDEIAAEVATEFPDVEWDKELVDAMTVRMVRKPETIDTVVGTNLHIDILSDLAAALAGSIGIAASANLDPTREFPSVFEPVHGSAFDIMGKGVANPIGCIGAAADMLAWLGEPTASEAVLQAVESVCRKEFVTRDMGGPLNTREATAAICKELEE